MAGSWVEWSLSALCLFAVWRQWQESRPGLIPPRDQIDELLEDERRIRRLHKRVLRQARAEGILPAPDRS